MPKLIEKVPEIIIKIVQALLDAIPKLIEALGEIWQAEIDFFMDPDNLEMLVNTAITFIQTLANTLIDSLPIIIDAIVKLVDTMCEKLSDEEALDQFIDTAIELMITLAQAFVDNMDLLLEKAPVIIEALVNAFIKIAPQIFKVAIELITKLGEGLLDHVSDLTQPIDDVWTWIKDTMTEVFSKVTSIGANLVSGIWERNKKYKRLVNQKIKTILQ